MLSAIKSFFATKLQPVAEGEPPEETGDRVRLAACAILMELAHADDEFTDSERSHIESALVRHFALTPDTARELMALAERENRTAVDHFQFTRLISANYDLGQKMLLAEIMWGVVTADGRIAEHEAYLVRKISNLLDLEPGYLSEAKRRAERRAEK